MSDSPNAEYDVATRDHERIRRWVSERDGYPAEADGDGDRATDLRIVFEDDADATRLDWEEFFDRFDEADLAMAYRVAGDDDAAGARVVPADEADLTDDGDAEAAVADERESARERARERDISENVDEQSEMRSSEAADEANLDNHRDQPPHSS